MKNINIILEVDTDKVTQANIQETCRFIGQRNNEPLENFTVYPNVGDTISILGLSCSNGNDMVNITKIEHNGGQNAFTQTTIGGNGKYPEQVITSILYETQLTSLVSETKDDYKFTIFFTVMNGSTQRNGVFEIDPKMQVNIRR